MRRHKLVKVSPIIIALLALLLMPVVPVQANGPEVSIPDATVVSGDTVTLPINITDVTNLGAATIWLAYNKDVVIVDNVADGDIGTVTYATYNHDGVTKMTWFNAYGVSGDKILFAQVTLHAATTSEDLTSTLNLDVKEFVDTSFNSITPIVTDGTLIISGAPAPPVAGVAGPTITAVSVSGLSTVTSLRVDYRGIVQKTCQLKSLDEKVSLDIAEGTNLLDSQGNALDSLSASEVTSPPTPPSQTAIMLAYDFGPDGATFEPAITLTISYDSEALPEGTTEDQLYIAYWDGSQWLIVESTVNSEANTVSAEVSHLTIFALISKLPPPALPAPPGLIVPPAPAKFATSSLSVAPSEVKPGEQVTISAVVTNTGGSEGSYNVVLKINGVEEGRKEVILRVDERETVSFTIVNDTEGSYNVDIDGKVGQFTVTAPPPVIPPTTPINWTLIWSIIGGVVVVGLVLWLVVFRGRARRVQKQGEF